jgi:DHA2 family lincomycin resistance protein-like MFS transporter
MTDTTLTQERAEAYRIPWGVIGLLLGAAFVMILNETTMAVALPVLMDDLGVSAQTAQWLTTAFLLTMSVVIPTTGYLLNRFTTRQVFLAAMSLFLAGTLLAALAPGFGVLLIARVVQGAGTAMMMPLLMTNILTLVPAARRGQVMGFVSIVMSMAPALGPAVSGLMLQVAGWRWVFGVMLPFAAVMLVLGALRMVNVGEGRQQRLDPISVVLSVVGFGGLVYALNRVGVPGETRVLVISAVIGGIAIALFVFRQLALVRLERPFLDLRTFRYHNFTVGLGVLMIAFLTLMGVALVYPIYLQSVRGLDTMTTGLLLLPGGLAMGLLGPLIGRIYDRFGPRVLVVPGAVVLMLMILAMGRLTTATSPIWLLLALHVGMSLALSCTFTPVFTATLNDLAPNLYSHGSAIVGTLQHVAGGAGAALLVAVMASRAAELQRAGVPEIPALLEGTHATFLVAGVLAAGAIVLGALLRKPAVDVEP